MKRVVLLFALLMNSAAWATTYYVDCSAARNGTGASAEDPKNSFSGITTGNADIFYLRPDVTCSAGKAMDSDAMITVGQNDDSVTIDTYPGSGSCDEITGDNCAILDGAGTVNIGIYGVNNDAFTVKNVVPRNFEYHNFRHWGTDTQDFTVTLDHVWLDTTGVVNDADATYSTLTKGTCGLVARASNGPYKTTVASDYLHTSGCARLGFDHRWWVVHVARHYTSSSSGTDRVIGGHGISAHPLSGDVTSGWTFRSGTCPGSDCVYSHAVVATADNEQMIWDRTTSPNTKLQRVADGDTTPDQGYFSVVSDADIYVNFGYVPPTTGNGVRIIRQPIQVDCFDCEFSGAQVQSGGSLEGSGFHADDSSPMRCFRCYSHDNYGSGFYFNSTAQYWSGIKAGCYGCIAANNGNASQCTGASCGFGFYANGEADFVDSVAVGSLREQFSVAGKFNTCGTIANTSASESLGYGYRFQNDATSKCTLTAANAWENGTNYSGGGSGTTVDPAFLGGDTPTTASGFVLETGSALRRVGQCYLATGCGYPGFRGNRGFVPRDVGPHQGH